MPPRRTARTVSAASTRSTAEVPAPAAKASTSTSTRATRTRKQSAAPVEEEGEGFPGESDQEEEEEKPAPKSRGKTTKKAVAETVKPARRGRKAVVAEEQEEEVVDDARPQEQVQETENDEEEDVATPISKPKAKASKKTAPAAVAAGRGKKSKVIELSDEEEDDLFATLPTRGASKALSVAPPPSTSDAESSNYHTARQTTPGSFGTAVETLNEAEDTEGSEEGGTTAGGDNDDEGTGDETITLDAPPLSASATPTKATSTSAPPPPPPSAPAGPKARLTIHKLVLVNFKSYAGRQEIGPFHKSFSAIVGPNGSGKSNTIDALLFVFGYRASKMRQGKLSELIHNSAGKEGLESCSVEVWFREIVDQPGVDNFLLVPNSQLVVTRTAYKNNSSKYSINDRVSTFTEVTSLLKGKGIDLDHNRFLILQGEVESIALMKAKAQNEHEDGLLEYLEDIIGTTKYKQPIEDASQEVEALNEQRGEKMNRLRVVEREKAALEDRKRDADDFVRDQNDLTRKKSMLWQFHMYTARNNMDLTAKSITSLTAELAEEQERNAIHITEIKELEDDHNQKLAAYEEVKRLTDTLIKDSKKFEKEEVALSEKKKHLVTKQKKFKKSITEDGHARSEAASAIDNFSSELDTNRAKVSQLEKKLEVEEAELDEIRDSLKDKTDVFTTQIEAKQRELEPWTAKISEKQSAIDVATSERDLLAQKATGAQEALDEAKSALKELKQGGGNKQEEYAELKKEAGRVKKQLTESEVKAQSIGSKGEALKAKLSSSRQKTDEAKASLAADKSENAVLSSLNKLKAQGRIKGFHGRLGDLGVIDDKYDVAVTTACSALNNLVVDTVEQGQACIEHLRKGNVGRASFMVLEKLPPRDLGRIETPEKVPRLFDLIKPKDARFAPAFYKGLFNTLVADDLVQAQRIGYGKKRWRVVTLAGQLIDPSGTMSGGGAKVSRGGMSSKFAGDKVEPEVVARYEHDMASAEEELAAWQMERKKLDVEVADLKKRLPEIEIAMEKIELDVQTGSKRVAEAEKRLIELQNQSKPDASDEKRIKALDSEISSLTKDADKLRQKSSTISEQIKELQNQILDVGGVKLRAIQSKVTTTKGLLDLANESITKAEVGQAKAERDVEKLVKAIEGNKAKLQEVEAELEVVEEDLKACSSDLGVIRAKVQEATDAGSDVQEALAASKAELDEKSAEVEAFRALELDISEKIKENERIQKDCKHKLKHWADQLSTLSLLEEDDDEEEDEEDETAAPTPAASSSATPDSVEGEDAPDATGADASIPRNKRAAIHELVEYSPDELRSVNRDLVTAEIAQLEEIVSKGNPNMAVRAEYKKREKEFLKRATDMEEVTARRDAMKKRYDELRKIRLEEFMTGFTAISAKLKEMYQMITMGGNAEIELIDSMDPFSEGVVLSIMPPKKSWRAIANLSGGEKTLASLALVFALHVFKPTPLYFMDEIDAALDFKNVSIVANYIQSKTQAAQFIVISLRNDMFELAHRLVGIYKTSNCTKSIAIDNKDLRTQAIAAAAAALNQRKLIQALAGTKASSAEEEQKRRSILEANRRQSSMTVTA